METVLAGEGVAVKALICVTEPAASTRRQQEEGVEGFWRQSGIGVDNITRGGKRETA